METDLTTIPDDVFAYIAQLRKEATRHRLQRNEARRERDEARELALDLAAELENIRSSQESSPVSPGVGK
ncbi:hypothetical protein [Mycolicibacter sinensis]|uniref:hypothetical protein n=1 Tax=Mycolicibacter sinensis (strain JDM601) TaxID=875328 RepID=UPI000B0279C1|nr:hypothetical protein [Mycolicibacter sinensis]